MFTGIITDIGLITEQQEEGRPWHISSSYAPETIALGASIACSGVCLTVTDKGTNAKGEHWFSVQTSPETARCTTVQRWKVGTKVNLERALKMGDELGGHIVSGHVDGVGTLLSITPRDNSHHCVFSVPVALAPFIAEKGSITVDGVSLTVNEVGHDHFAVTIIPHTWNHTCFQFYTPQTQVNIEIDVLARYIARQQRYV